MDASTGKIVFGKIRWRIEKYVNPHRPAQSYDISRPTCMTCQVDLKERVDGPAKATYWCPNPLCARHSQEITFTQSTTDVRSLAVNMWHGSQRIKEPGKWINLDQELVPIVSTEGKDSENDYWAEAKFFNTKRGNMLMVLVGKRGGSSKVQFFVKDGEDQISSDQVGDLNPKEIFLGFKAYFSDGATTETKY